MTLNETVGAPAVMPLWLSGCPMPTVSGLADQLGWLAHDLEAVDVQPSTLPGAAPGRPHPQHVVQSLPGLLREGGNAAALWARSEGAATRLLGLTWIDAFQGVLALPGAGIASPAQLEGRRLGLPQRDGDHIDVERATARRGFHAATSLAGLFSDEVAYVDLPVAVEGDPYAAEAAALLRGDVDAIHVSGPAGRALASRIGAVEVVDLGAHLDPMVRVNATTPAALTVDARLLAERPEVVERVLATLLRVGVWAETHGDTVARAAVEATGTSARAVAAAYGDGLARQLHVDLSTHKLAALSAQKDFLLTHGFLAGDVDIAAWVAPEPLAAARNLLAA